MPDPIDVSGELALVAAIIQKVRKDLKNKDPIHRRAALSFCDGAYGSIEFWADELGLETYELRARLLGD